MYDCIQNSKKYTDIAPIKIKQIEAEIEECKRYDFNVFNSKTFDQQIDDIAEVYDRIVECKISRQKYFEMVFNPECDFDSPIFIIKIKKILLLEILINLLEEIVSNMKLKTIKVNPKEVVKLN